MLSPKQEAVLAVILIIVLIIVAHTAPPMPVPSLP